MTLLLYYIGFLIILFILFLISVAYGMFRCLKGYHKFKDSGKDTAELEILNNLRIAAMINIFLGFVPVYFASIYAWYRLRSLKKNKTSSEIQIEMRKEISRTVRIFAITFLIYFIFIIAVFLLFIYNLFA